VSDALEKPGSALVLSHSQYLAKTEKQLRHTSSLLNL
jgi:hypothetical protein